MTSANESTPAVSGVAFVIITTEVTLVVMTTEFIDMASKAAE
jgi:hypothetical protein